MEAAGRMTAEPEQVGAEEAVRRHPVQASVERELPGLSLWSLPTPVLPGPTTPALRKQLGEISGRWSGAKAVALRSQPIPHGYRVFFRHTGVDPDEHLVPIEQAARDRMFHGGFQSRSRVADALLIALVETGVPVWILDEGAIDGDLVLRTATADDGGVLEGRLVVADARRALAELFGGVVAGAGVNGESRRARLFSVAVNGVAALCVEEALFLAAEALTD